MKEAKPQQIIYLLGVIFNCSGGQFSALTMEGKLISDSR